MCSFLSEQKEQLLLTGNLWGPTAGLGWLGTGSKGTVGKHVSLQTRFSAHPNPPDKEHNVRSLYKIHLMCTIYKLYSLYTWVLNIYISTKENGRELSSSYNSTSRSLNFNSEFLFKIKVFCNRRRYYSSEIKNLFFISTSRLSRLSNPTYYFPVTIKYKFKSKASRITREWEGRQEKSGTGRERRTHKPVVLLQRTGCHAKTLFLFCFETSRIPIDLPEEQGIK